MTEEMGTAPWFNELAYSAIETLTDLAMDMATRQLKTGYGPGYEPITWDLLRRMERRDAIHVVRQMLAPLGFDEAGNAIPNPMERDGVKLATRLLESMEGETYDAA